jgi:hypothetical protein
VQHAHLVQSVLGMVPLADVRPAQYRFWDDSALSCLTEGLYVCVTDYSAHCNFTPVWRWAVWAAVHCTKDSRKVLARGVALDDLRNGAAAVRQALDGLERRDGCTA